MSINIIKHSGTLDFVNNDFRVWKYDQALQRSSSIDDHLISEIGINDDLGVIFSDNNGLYYQVIDFDDSDFLYWDFANNQLTKLGSHEAFSLSRIYNDSDVIIFFDAGSGDILEFKLTEKSFYHLFNIPYPCAIHVSCSNSIIAISRGQVVECFDFNGSKKWSKTLQDYKLDQPLEGYDYEPEIKQCSHVYGSNILFHVKAFQLACINAYSGELKWLLPDSVMWQWCVGNNGKVYSIFKGHLKIIDAETGQVLLDKPINADWIRDDANNWLNLFQVEVSATHLWCGFMGKGLCAINLETAEVDWHDFDGLTCNRKPIIKNNRIYVQMMGGGIGLDSEGNSSSTQEYILEGEGGYIADSDNEFIVF